jgi:hypothetical protein
VRPSEGHDVGRSDAEGHELSHAGLVAVDALNGAGLNVRNNGNRDPEAGKGAVKQRLCFACGSVAP